MKFLPLAMIGLSLSVGVGTAAGAVISAGPNVGGYATFTDSNTGRNWLKTNTFFNQTPTVMINAANAAGFTLANRADVEALLNSLPIDSGQWAGIAATMGKAPNRQLVWAAYGPITVSNRYGYAFAYDFDNAWRFVEDVADAGQVPNGGSPDADMNIWAYTTGGGAVPEPAAWAMLIAGFGLVGAAARRRRAVAA